MRRLLALPLVLPLALALALPLSAAGAPVGQADVGARPGSHACRAGTVSLTFDDGPSAEVTPRLVRILVAAHVPATFFMVGERVDSAPAAARLVDSRGFLVANHSYAHADMTGQSSAAIRATLRATAAALHRAGVRTTDLMRPPYGALDPHVRRAVAAAGLVPVLWDVDPRDWEGGTSDQIAARILAGLHPGANTVLQHDGVGNSPASVGAVPQVVAEARRRGYCFVALDERGRPGFPTPHAGLSLDSSHRTTPEGRRAVATITLDRSAARETTVRLRARSGTARPGSDFPATDVSVRVPAGARSVTVSVPVLRDRLDEPTERFRLTLSRPRGLLLDDAEAVVVVADRDPEPLVSGVDVAAQEPAAGQTLVPVRFALARASGRMVRLTLALVPGTATAADAAAVAPLPTVVTIPAGRLAATVLLRILADGTAEPDEQLRLRVTDARYARIGHRDAVVTIHDAPEPSSPRPPPHRS